MKNFVRVDAHDFVNQHYVGPESPGDGWTEVSQDATMTVASMTRWQLIGGALIDSGKSKLPPSPHLRWNGQDWADPRAPEQVQADAWAAVRTQRNRLLLESDWTDTYSAPTRLGQTLYSSWQTYRQALRDVTLQPDPFNITWPQPPG
jgi:hypothetical protein